MNTRSKTLLRRKSQVPRRFAGLDGTIQCGLYAVALTCLGCADDAGVNVPTTAIQSENTAAPVWIECSHNGFFADGKYSWSLTIRQGGDATLIVQRPRDDENPATMRYSVREKMPQIERAITELRASELPDFVGYSVADGNVRRMQFEIGGTSKSITIMHLGTGPLSDIDRRALMLWGAIRDCVTEPDAADTRVYDEKRLRG